MTNQDKVKTDKWLKVKVNTDAPKKVSRGRHNLSRHVLNLRETKSAVIVQPVKLGAPRVTIPEPLRFNLRLNLLNPVSSIFYIPWWRLERRWPVVRGLTINFILEIIYRLFYFSVRSVAMFYYRVFVYCKALAREVIEDVANFVGLLATVLSLNLYKRKNDVQVMLPGFGQVMLFLILLLALITPIKWFDLKNSVSNHKDQILSYAQAAMDQFSLASEKLFIADYENAFADFSAANISLAKAQLKIDQINNELAGLVYRLPVISDKVDSAQKVIEAARLLADSGETLTITLSSFPEVTEIENMNLGANVRQLKDAVDSVLPKLNAAQTSLAEADLSGVDTLMIGNDWNSIRNRMNDLVLVFTQTSKVLDVMVDMIPVQGNRRYLLVFQNNSELRPTGGFMGSLAFLDFIDGKLQKMEIPGGGPYDFQGQLVPKINPPQPLTLINSLWQLQDANWFFDFPSSAEKINWFLENSGADKVDGIIAVNPDLVLDLLKITGPINLPEYNKVITSENFIRETQEAVELEYDRVANRPKQFIADLAPVILDKMLASKTTDQLKILGQVVNLLNTKSIQMYFSGEQYQAKVKELGWAGDVKTGFYDYLAIVRTNIGGGKSDLVTYDKVKQEVNISESGKVSEKVYLTREHRGDPFDIFFKRDNISWIRFYVPSGAKLVSASGFADMSNYVFKPSHLNSQDDVYLKTKEERIIGGDQLGVVETSEFGKTVFAGWMDVPPGESRTITVEYELPDALPMLDNNSNSFHYDSYYQQQSGVKPLDFAATINLPDNLILRWQESSGKVSVLPNSINFTDDWENDEFLGLILSGPLNK